MEAEAEANGVALGIEHFGDPEAPLLLLAGGTTMLSWPDALCEALAREGRHVVRYDLRDCGRSTTLDPEAPEYMLRDLADDAAALAGVLDDRPAYLAGIGVGGMVAQVAALDHPDSFSALALVGTRPVAPGPVATELFLDGKDEATINHIRQMNPLGRLGEVKDIADVVSFLVGPDGGWVNGQVIRANGGVI